MTTFPMYLSEYPNMNTTFPFHLSIHRIQEHFPSHRHDYLEFSLVIEGYGSELINGKEHKMEPGTFTFILPYQIHEISAAKESTLVLFNCIFDLGLLHNLGLLNSLVKTEEILLDPYIKIDAHHFSRMRSILEEMLEEYKENYHHRDILIKAKLAEILVLFERLRRRNNSTHVSSGKTTKKGIIWEVIQYIHIHYHDDISLSHLANKFHVSVPYLSELFKEHVGQNFVHFLHEVRIRHACSLLTSTTIPVTDIALEVGYRSFQTFSRVFRDQKKLTPTAYRKTQLSK
ncbi:AraC family transcriptional regulator [Metabacillus schmidteae]|uniref:AraC family transcriptional regulator n=1 Tax=Metabacillus schmidteae TaxID=2730405 RepID=UPI00158BC39F|nr:AraC family transcriptional regulator [Metabacillus schmidteae]